MYLWDWGIQRYGGLPGRQILVRTAAERSCGVVLCYAAMDSSAAGDNSAHFLEQRGVGEMSVRLIRRELPDNHSAGYDGHGFNVSETRLRVLTQSVPDDKSRGKVCTKHAKYGFYSFNLPESVDVHVDMKGCVRERTERVQVREFNSKVLVDLCALHELVATEQPYRGEYESDKNYMFLRYVGMEKLASQTPPMENTLRSKPTHESTQESEAKDEFGSQQDKSVRRHQVEASATSLGDVALKQSCVYASFERTGPLSG